MYIIYVYFKYYFRGENRVFIPDCILLTKPINYKSVGYVEVAFRCKQFYITYKLLVS